MPRPPRRRKINLPTRSSRAVKDTILYGAPNEKVIQPSVETSSQQSATVATNPIPSSGLPSSPPRRVNRKKPELVIPDSEEDDAVSDILQEEEEDGGEALNVGEMSFLPRSTSTPKSGIANIARRIQAQRRTTRDNSQTLPSQEIRRNVVLSEDAKEAGLDDLEADNRSPASSQSTTSDPFGFAKIRGIRVTKALSSSPTQLSSVSNESESTPRSRAENPDREYNRQPQVEQGLLSSPSPPSSPLSELGKTPSPAKAFLTGLENPRDPSARIVAARDGNASQSTTAVKQSKKERKKLHQVTTAQLTELLPQRPTRRRRQRTRSLDFDDAEDSDTDTLADSKPITARKSARSKQAGKKRPRSNKENIGPIDVPKERGTKPKSVQSKPLDGTINGAPCPGSVADPNENVDDAISNADNEDVLEQSTDSEAMREMESERLRQKFKEVDEWHLEVENVPPQSDSSFL
ncbi:hypothetical protein V1525DRAFT_401855 [Lipomyces kononenkoae]|uniref:Uncharacterized protein n=1 Tax=Lipomyces kononenkoae TaxID=34357 RepID=A0ACC3T2V9_LIPKO